MGLWRNPQQSEDIAGNPWGFFYSYSLINIFDTQQFLTPPAGCSSNILCMRRWFLPSCRTPPAS